jgi:hypothetical protein
MVAVGLSGGVLAPLPPSCGRRTDDRSLPERTDELGEPEGLLAVDRRLAALCRQRGTLRAVLARIACRLVVVRAWERIGYARLSDYAVERLGLAARSVRSLALVGEAFHAFPRLEEALAAGTLGWTKVRLLASLPADERGAGWIARASRVTAAELSKMVRAVDRGSLDAEDAEEATGRSRVFEVRCSPDVRWKWHAARGAACRAAGRMVSVAEAAELIAAEVLSSVPVDEPRDQDACNVDNAPWSRPNELPLIDGLEDADPFELDERLRGALSIEQCLDARIGALLVRVWNGWVHLALGYSTREAYARERLGMDPTTARALVRLERAAASSEPFARAYRTGSLSAVKASVLLPLLSADPLGRFTEAWVAWAGRVTVRRLRADVEWAVALEDTDPDEFRRTGGLPLEAGGERPVPDRGIGAQPRGPEADTTAGPEHCSVRFFGPAAVVQLFKAVLCTVRRRLEKIEGRLPTEGEALGAMLDHVLSCWGADGKIAARHRVRARTSRRTASRSARSITCGACMRRGFGVWVGHPIGSPGRWASGLAARPWPRTARGISN